MKNLFRRLALTATTVALSAGTLTLTLTASTASAEPSPKLGPSLDAKVNSACADPRFLNDGSSTMFDPNTPDLYNVYATGEVDDPATGVTGRWALVRAYFQDGHSLRCLVAEVDEHTSLPGKAAGTGTIDFESINSAHEFGFNVLNPAFRQDHLKFEHSVTASKHTFGDLFFVDADNDPTTPLVAQVGGHLDRWPLGINATFSVSGKAAGTETKDVVKTVTVKRTAAERAAALKIKRAADKKAHAVHDKKTAKVSKAKSADRKKVNKSKASATVKAAKLKAIDSAARTKYKAHIAECKAVRKDNRAKYRKAIAPYKKQVVTKVTIKTDKPFVASAVTQIYQPA